MSVDTRSREHALALDAADPLTCLREEFVIPTRGELLSKTLAVQEHSPSADTPCIYLCGNSLGLQPRRTATRITQYLQTWASRGVYGHFKPIEDSPLPPWVSVDEVAAEQMAKVVGAAADEVAVMGSLTANLHLMMASFYRPDKTRHKIILEGKAFPSDHYAVESQIRHHNLSPSESMILIGPQSSDNPTLTTEQILKVIDEHASTTALILLPGIQYYTGQYFDIPTITSYAHSKGLLIGWDLAHAVGNVELHLHDWDVDFAVWCNYKYMNSGPGAIAGAFVHERHGKVDLQTSRDQPGYRPRLSGWWGGDRTVRFAMDNKFIPIPGAAGYQVSNPSAIDTTAVCASLEVFNDAGMAALRERSIRLTAYLQCLLLDEHTNEAGPGDLFRIITPLNLAERGAQLSVLLQPGLLDPVMEILEEEGVVVDERRPDVIRVAPAPLYNSFLDVWEFVRIFKAACRKAWSQNHAAQASSAMVDGGKDDRGWSQIK